MRLLRLLQNLITNAVDALGSKPGGRIDLRGRGRLNFISCR